MTVHITTGSYNLEHAAGLGSTGSASWLTTAGLGATTDNAGVCLGASRQPMFRFVAGLTERRPVSNIESQFGVVGPRFDVVSVERATLRSTFGAGVGIASENRSAPGFVLVARDGFPSNGLASPVSRMILAALEVWGGLPLRRLRSSTNPRHEACALFGISPRGKSGATGSLSPFFRRIHGALGFSDRARIRLQLGDDLRPNLVVAVRAFPRAESWRRPFLLGSARVHGASHLERCSAPGTFKRDANALVLPSRIGVLLRHRDVLARARTRLSSAVLQSAWFDKERRSAYGAATLDLRLSHCVTHLSFSWDKCSK